MLAPKIIARSRGGIDEYKLFIRRLTPMKRRWSWAASIESSSFVWTTSNPSKQYLKQHSFRISYMRQSASVCGLSFPIRAYSRLFADKKEEQNAKPKYEPKPQGSFDYSGPALS